MKNKKSIVAVIGVMLLIIIILLGFTVWYYKFRINKNVEKNQENFKSKITWDNAPEGTLLYAIKNDNTVTEALTVPGAEPSSENEAVFASTEDDYGTSYYYRGAVNNNFVNFSGMCFRIVRVQGDGSIKIALANKDHECNSNQYPSADDSAFISIDFAYKYLSEGNSNDLKYETSDIKSLLDNWLKGKDYQNKYTGTIEKFEKKIDDTKLIETEWCNDMSFASKTYFDKNNEEIEEASKAEYFNYKYGAYERIATTKQPTLKCDMTGLDETKTLKFNSKVGLLTADEIAFAGGSYEGSNYTYYLKDNANRKYWTMSPSNINSTGDNFVWFVMDGNENEDNTRGKLNDYTYDNYSLSVRPAVALNSNVKIASGNGTQENPYVVN